MTLGDGGHFQQEVLPPNVAIRRRLFDIGDEEVRREALITLLRTLSSSLLQLELQRRRRVEQKVELYSEESPRKL